MPAGRSDLHLNVLTRIGQRLPSAASAEEAGGEVVRALADLGVAASVSTVQSDMAVIIAVNVPVGSSPRLSPALATRLIGMRVPVDGVESLRCPVRLRRPYCGGAGLAEAVRNLAPDSTLARALPNPTDDLGMVAVPVIARDRVVAVITAWARVCGAELTPTLEAAAAMLAAACGVDTERSVARFSPQPAAAPSHRVRGVVDGYIEHGITAAVQPIVRLHDGTVIGYEGLARFTPCPDISTPDELFSAATSLHVENALDLACLRASLREAPNLCGADLFVNVLIGTLLDSQGRATLDDAVRDLGVDPASVVLEFSEREPVPDLARLQRIAAELRSRGFRIAVDDAGAGHASMRVIAELRPEFIKVDRSLIHAVDSDRARRALVVALLSFSGHIGARVIAEGIETRAEQDALLSLGVQFGQGWQLGRPVLTRPVDGHPDAEVVDATWFARRRVEPARATVPIEVLAATRTTAPLRRMKPSEVVRGGLPRALSDAALALQGEHDPMRILGVMAEQMSHVVPVGEMAIFVADYETHQFIPVFATGPDRVEILADTFSLDAGMTGWAFSKGTPENVTDTSDHPLARQVPGTPVVHESLLLIPLVAGELKLGIINCWRLGVGRFSERELEAATLFAHIAAAAWRNAQLYTELLSAAMTDPLTRLYNSRWLRDAAERDLIRSTRDGKPLALLLIDLDHFKTVNDSGGHAAGDLVLQRVASRLRTTVRGADAVVRLGGEEFVALLHDCNMDGAASVAEAMRVSVRDITLPEGCGLERLTASIGVAGFPDDGADLDQLLAAADRAMYAAKHGGRDRVVRATTPSRTATIVSLPRQLRAAVGRGARSTVD